MVLGSQHVDSIPAVLLRQSLQGTSFALSCEGVGMETNYWVCLHRLADWGSELTVLANW
jgi:hypothetical protein